MDAAMPSAARARLARRRLLRAQANAAAAVVAAFAIGGTYKYAIGRLAVENRPLAMAISGSVLALLILGALALRRWPHYRARREARIRATIEELRLAAPALTPAERQREYDRLRAAGGEQALHDLRELFAAQPGGMRPLPALCVKDPDDPFKASRGLVVRALVAYPAAAALGGALVEAISKAGVEPVEWLGVFLLPLPGFLTWRDRDAQEAQPGERFAWSLASVLALLVWIGVAIAAINAAG